MIRSILVNGDSIKIQFNLNISSRVVTYLADPYKKEIPQPSGQEITKVFTFAPTAMLATYGGAGANDSFEDLRNNLEGHGVVRYTVSGNKVGCFAPISGIGNIDRLLYLY